MILYQAPSEEKKIMFFRVTTAQTLNNKKENAKTQREKEQKHLCELVGWFSMICKNKNAKIHSEKQECKIMS